MVMTGLHNDYGYATNYIWQSGEMTMAYQNILVAVDLSDEAETVVGHAIELASVSQASLTLVHVMEPFVQDSAYEMSPAIPVDLQEAMQERAENFLQQLLEKFSLAETQFKVEMGSIKGKIFQIADENNVDLIVIGTHGRHGISLLLGSTASAILHGTPCDVLAVRIHATE